MPDATDASSADAHAVAAEKIRTGEAYCPCGKPAALYRGWMGYECRACEWERMYGGDARG